MSAAPGNSAAWGPSIAAHAALVLAVFLVTWANPFGVKRREIQPIRVIEKVIEAPVVAPPVLEVAPRKPKEVPPPPRKTPPAFGINKNTLTTEGSGVAVKAGNTLAKEVDQTPATDALPVATEEYLVSKMPRLKSEIRVEYPAAAKAKKIEGPVVLEILIDAVGRVRDVRLIQGPGEGLNEAAAAAVRDFSFEPAQVDGQPVAVRIRYTYRFVLRNE